jgi:conjugal transfer mating pair stabilization protein TraG
MSVEVITSGGGQYIVNVLNAVAAWTGGGGFRSMLQVVMVMGLGYSLLVMAFSLNWRVLFNWFLSATAMYLCMIVPTATVVVSDTVNPTVGNGAVANVPIGLAVVASFSSQVNNWLTKTAESVFTMPASLTYSAGGMIYPTRLNDLTKQFTILGPIMKANVVAYLQQCTFYDILLAQGNTIRTMAYSNDLLAAIGPGSPARSVAWIPGGGGPASIINCQAAYQNIVQAYPDMGNNRINDIAPSFYPNLPAVSAATQLKNDLPTMAQAYYGGTSMSAQMIFQQRSLVNAFMEARANFGSGGGDTFAALHADVQAQNSYISAARQAMTWVPVLNLVLTITFYAMFPVVFPLFLFPQTGPALLKGYLTGFFYLASWGPIYAVLHMFITQYSAAQLSALAPNGMTMATMAGIDAVDQNMETLAGYLLMFVPVMAAGMAKGAMSIASNTTSMLAPAMQAAEAAAVERTTGNYAYGNSQFQNVTGHQVNTAPTWNVAASSIPQVNMRGDNGAITSAMADGSTVYNTAPAISRFGFSATEMQSVTGNLQQTGAQYHTRANSLRETSSERWSHGMRILDSLSSGSRSAHGSEGAVGSQGGNTASQFDRQGTDSKHQTGSARTIGESLSSGRSLGHTETNTFGVNAGAKAGAGGKVLGADVGASAGATWDHKWNKTTGDQESRSTSDSLSQSQSANVAHYDANGQDITLTDGGYWRDGSFHRVENFSEKRHAVERDFSQAQSLERQASRSDEVGARLEHMASISRSNGYQISDDMSQVIASRYAEMAASQKFRDLGAPSLTHTTPSPHQREVRNMIVGRILEQYAAEGMTPTLAGLQDPTATMGNVKGPADFPMPGTGPASEPRARGARFPSLSPNHVQNSGTPKGAISPHKAPGDQRARTEIEKGADEVGRDTREGDARFRDAIKGTESWKPRAKKNTEGS